MFLLNIKCIGYAFDTHLLVLFTVLSILIFNFHWWGTGVVKVVEVSREFEHCGRWLTQAEQHEVMRYTRSRLPFLLEAVVSLLRNVRTSLAALNHHTRQQLAQQLVPEVSDEVFGNLLMC